MSKKILLASALALLALLAAVTIILLHRLKSNLADPTLVLASHFCFAITFQSYSQFEEIALHDHVLSEDDKVQDVIQVPEDAKGVFQEASGPSP